MRPDSTAIGEKIKTKISITIDCLLILVLNAVFFEYKNRINNRLTTAYIIDEVDFESENFSAPK
ncbi:hypothetical protein EC204B2_00530 [Escherichia coli]|nr:hypothetical protein EC204B2_00530 [Escherichia coli]BEC31787.1 hypothetical protein VEE73_16380 [Escherichia coli]